MTDRPTVPTPRTDACIQQQKVGVGYLYPKVVDLARTLERELAAETFKRRNLDLENAGLIEHVASLAVDAGRMQARIDELMLEYCPDDITPEQWAEYERNQRGATPEEKATIAAALDSASKDTQEVGP